MIRRFCLETLCTNIRYGVIYFCQTMRRKRKQIPSSDDAAHQAKNEEESAQLSTGSSSSSDAPTENAISNGDEKSSKKRKLRCVKTCKTEDIDQQNPFHFFTDAKDVCQFSENLLQWYDVNKRDLPWRKWAFHPNPNQRAYAIWVSEIMLQQTQVATVIDYYNRWMTKWPTLEDLASCATLEEVNEMWSGLGYYSRGRRLYRGAQKVVETLCGDMPKDAESLMKQLPGVGRYTAGAIASIAFKEKTGVVDGNVIRVLSRTRAIGSDSTSAAVQSAIWYLANTLVDAERPGDFNQAMMELGATICTPKAPSCDKCPIRSLCRAYQHQEKLSTFFEEKHKKEVNSNGPAKPYILPDIECAADGCQLCIPATEGWDTDLGVMNFPRKPKKKPPRQEQLAVCVFEKKLDNKCASEYLLVQRPQTGLLAGLWEFPSVLMDSHHRSVAQRKEAIDILIKDQLKIKVTEKCERRSVGEVIHIFSHIEQTYCLETFSVNGESIQEPTAETSPPYRWFTAQDFWTGAVATAMKKCFSAYLKSINPQKVNSKKMKFDSNRTGHGKKQTALDTFFKPVQKKR